MKIRYKNNRFKMDLLLSLIWGFVAILDTSPETGTDWLNYIAWVLSVGYLLKYLYEFKHQYLTITEDTIKKHSLAGRQIKLKDINSIKMLAGDYIISSDNKRLTIDKEIIDENSLSELNAILEQIAPPADRTVFSKIAI